MNVLRIRGSLRDPDFACEWAILSDGRVLDAGQGTLRDLPRHPGPIQLLLPAEDVLLIRARVPRQARRQAGAALAFAVEEQTVGDPDGNLVSWLGTVGEEDVLAVVDRAALSRWVDALAAIGIRDLDVQCETLLLPWAPGEWSLAWDGSDGFVRTGELEGIATDSGDRQSPPLALRLLLAASLERSAGPGGIALHPVAAEGVTVLPDADAWIRELGIAVRIGDPWDWRSAPAGTGVRITRQRRGWGSVAGLGARLRPAAWILGAALAFHVIALAGDWAYLASEQRTLRNGMESRFRAAFPDASAVVDPVLQMRRKLTEARHAAGLADPGDFPVMAGRVAAALADAPAGQLRILSYEYGRMSLEFSPGDRAALQGAASRLESSGFIVEPLAAAAGESVVATVLTVRSP